MPYSASVAIGAPYPQMTTGILSAKVGPMAILTEFVGTTAAPPPAGAYETSIVDSPGCRRVPTGTTNLPSAPHGTDSVSLTRLPSEALCTAESMPFETTVPSAALTTMDRRASPSALTNAMRPTPSTEIPPAAVKMQTEENTTSSFVLGTANSPEAIAKPLFREVDGASRKAC